METERQIQMQKKNLTDEDDSEKVLIDANQKIKELNKIEPERKRFFKARIF